ncbi:MAG: ATP-binding cassette domain-containing protein [Oscillospiraceae bacterium]|nr:ATP-binding cassette domain-containing protein [Oscillospiraceae bacterium]
MAENSKFIKATYEIMEQLLEVDQLENALAGSLEVIVRTLDAEAGVIWYLDPKTGRLSPLFHIGPSDISNVSIENGVGIEGIVTSSGQAAMLADTASDPRFEGTVFDESGFQAKTMICVPLNNLHEVIGCVQVINKKDGSPFTEEELELCRHMASLAALTIEEKGLQVDAGEDKEVLISLRNVIKEFPSGEGVSRVLKGINLDIYKNEMVVVLGESGCGKSTMMNIIGGMDYLTEGELLIEGKDFSHPTDADLTRFRREYMGFVFQSYNLMPNLTAQENVQFIADIAPDPMTSEEAIRKVGLEGKGNNYPSALSGGQQQRVAIARAIVKNPHIIFADEPTAALDYQTSIEVLTVFEEIRKARGTTIMMITHNPEIAKMANRVVKLRNGRVASIRTNLNPLPAAELVW